MRTIVFVLSLLLLAAACDTDPLLYGDPSTPPPPVCHDMCQPGNAGVLSRECASNVMLHEACRCFDNDQPLVNCQDFGHYCVAACP